MEHESTQAALAAPATAASRPAKSDTATMEFPRDVQRADLGEDPRVAAFVGLKRAHERLIAMEIALFKPRGLSAPQYNVLRVLRAAEGGRLSCGEISRRLIHRVPDVTRLVDRLQKAELVTRTRRSGDARVVDVTITTRARDILGELDRPVLELFEEAFAPLSGEEIETLVQLLDRLEPPAEG